MRCPETGVLGKLVLSSVLLSVVLGCRDEGPGSVTTGDDSGGSSSHAGGSGGSGGEGGDSELPDGGTGGATPATTTMSTATESSSTSGSSNTEGTSTSGSSGAGGEGGLGGAGPDTEDPRCQQFPDDNPGDRCEPRLRALFSASAELLTFEYDAEGRLATVGDERSHTSHVSSRYTYDEQGRVTSFESGCTTPTDPCSDLYEFSYADAGWLQTVIESDHAGERRSTYDEAGRLTEVEYSDAAGTYAADTYHYRVDGQTELIESFSVAEEGVRTLVTTRTYEYGDDDLVDLVEHEYLDDYHDDYIEVFSYVIEAGRVRAIDKEVPQHDWSYATTLDDRGRPAFQLDIMEFYNVEDYFFYGYTAGWYAGNRTLLRLYSSESGTKNAHFFEHAVSVPDNLFPYAPFDLTEADIDDFSYEGLARQVSFGDDGRLERVTASWGSRVSEFSVLRCGSAVVETTDVPEEFGDDDVKIYYYGCDDFVLPDPPDLAP